MTSFGEDLAFNINLVSHISVWVPEQTGTKARLGAACVYILVSSNTINRIAMCKSFSVSSV